MEIQIHRVEFSYPAGLSMTYSEVIRCRNQLSTFCTRSSRSVDCGFREHNKLNTMSSWIVNIAVFLVFLSFEVALGQYCETEKCDSLNEKGKKSEILTMIMLQITPY